MSSKIKRREIPPDPLYNNVSLARFINQVMRKGKKTVARKVVYSSLEIIKEKTKADPLEIFEKAIDNAIPSMEVRPKRVGGATYQVPIPVKGRRGLTLAMRWIVQAAKSKKGRAMAEKLADELMAAADNSGEAVKRKNDTRRIAEANRAFAHFAW
jgi:small subunit ribosomal protein S7